MGAWIYEIDLLVFNLDISRVSARYLTRSLRSLVRYRVEDSKINFIYPTSASGVAVLLKAHQELQHLSSPAVLYHIYSPLYMNSYTMAWNSLYHG